MFKYDERVVSSGNNPRYETLMRNATRRNSVSKTDVSHLRSTGMEKALPQHPQNGHTGYKFELSGQFIGINL